MVPLVGVEGIGSTVSVYVATASAQGAPNGLFVVIVIVTGFPSSPDDGVYVKLNGDEPEVPGLTVPLPSCVIVIRVALVNVFPLTLTAVVPHVFPLMLLRVMAGPLTQPHETEKLLPVVVHPDALRTVIVWLPFATPLNVAAV